MVSTILCGPLLRYTYIDDYPRGTWHGSLLVVSEKGPAPSALILSGIELKSEHLPINIYSEDGHVFWRFPISVPLARQELRVDYDIQSLNIHGSFWVPGKSDSMRIMFHSCNGFCLDVPKEYTNLALWNDVLRTHIEHPFHVMIGGGDQIYSDKLCHEGPLGAWAKQNPARRTKTPFTEELAHEIDKWYFNNYINWFTTPPFSKASATVPSMQLWDDHDIMDGYGSYHDVFMRAPIFLGLGKIAHKYYMLFQQHTAPEEIEHSPDPSFVVGMQPGPYIPYKSVSLCSSLGPRSIFYGLDCRGERTRHRICYESTYDVMFDRLEQCVIKGQTKHLVILLGVPIAYPRLVWLEGILSSYLITAPFRFMNKFFKVGESLFNTFDGSSELLDDLDDHWCAVHHKRERNMLIRRLQDFAGNKGVRVTILSGDVHLAAVGRFFSNPRRKTPQNKDKRYMVNIISSAITNAPPPKAVANLMHRQNRLHFLGKNTQENLMHLFREDPQGKKRKCSSTMPARNYTIITEHAGLTVQSRTNMASDGNGLIINPQHHDLDVAKKEKGGTAKEDISAATPEKGTTRPFALDVAFRVEIDPKNPEGKTKSYGFAIPSLEV